MPTNITGTKWADGTMMCTRRSTGFSLLANGFASFGPYTLPVTFTSPAAVFPTGSAVPTNTYDFYGLIGVSMGTGSNFTLALRNGATAQSAVVTLVFWGRWF